MSAPKLKEISGNSPKLDAAQLESKLQRQQLHIYILAGAVVVIMISLGFSHWADASLSAKVDKFVYSGLGVALVSAMIRGYQTMRDTMRDNKRLVSILSQRQEAIEKNFESLLNEIRNGQR